MGGRVDKMTISVLRPAQTEQEGALLLFQEVTEILIRSGVDFVVVGGWVPFLFHSNT